jgi:beta-glucanase (GH16 family)
MKHLKNIEKELVFQIKKKSVLIEIAEKANDEKDPNYNYLAGQLLALSECLKYVKFEMQKKINEDYNL